MGSIKSSTCHRHLVAAGISKLAVEMLVGILVTKHAHGSTDPSINFDALD